MMLQKKNLFTKCIINVCNNLDVYNYLSYLYTRFIDLFIVSLFIILFFHCCLVFWLCVSQAVCIHEWEIRGYVYGNSGFMGCCCEAVWHCITLLVGFVQQVWALKHMQLRLFNKLFCSHACKGKTSVILRILSYWFTQKKNTIHVPYTGTT